MLDQDPDLENIRNHPEFARIKGEIQKKVFAATVTDKVRKSVHLLRETNVRGALEALLEAELTDPRNAEVHVRLAHCYALLAQREQANACMGRAVAFGLTTCHARHIHGELIELSESAQFRERVTQQHEAIVGAITDEVDAVLTSGIQHMHNKNYDQAEVTADTLSLLRPPP